MKNKVAKTPTKNAKEATAEKVLNLLIAKLEKGVNAWRKPWDCHGNPTVNPEFFPINLFTLKPYSGINCEILEPGFYAGFSQITANGGHVKKGAKASEEALKTLMAASASAKFAFAYIAEFYEEAKAQKEEENNKKKTEAPLTLLPAIIAPTSTSVPAVFKAEPFEACYKALPEMGEAQIKMEEKTTMKFYTIKLKSCAQFGDLSGGASIREKTLSEEVNKLNFTKHQLWQWLENYEMQHENGNNRTEKWDKNLTIEEIVRIFQKSAYGITLEIEEKPCKKQPKATSKPWEDAKPLPFTKEQLDEALSDQKNSAKEKKIEEEKKSKMEIRLNYIGKGKCINDIIIRGAKGANVTKADLNKVAEAIRGGKFHVFENDEGNLWLFGWIEDEDGHITFGTDEDSLNIVYGEGDKPIKVTGLVTVSKSYNGKLNS